MKTRKVKVGKLFIGGDASISVQSMCNTKTSDAEATIRQIHGLEEIGCEIIRVSVPDMKSAEALKKIKANISISLVADIHFDYRLAIESAKYVDKLRINPGNIGKAERIAQVIGAAKEHSLPIRIGINLGSMEKEISKKYGHTAEAMLESAKRHIRILEDNDFYNIIVSLKASDIRTTIDANRLFAEKYDYPLHLGVTEAGSVFAGTINNSIGIGTLLEAGIGNTIRVSLAGDPTQEVKVGWQILKALNLRSRGLKVVACPTCARTEIDVPAIAKELECYNTDKQLKVAVMGCIVNGPGEAKKSDIAVVGAKDKALLYRKGELSEEIEKKDIMKKLIDGIEKT